MIIEQAERPADYRLAITLHVPGQAHAWRPVVRVARKALLNVERILRRLHVLGRQRNAGQWITDAHRREGVGQLNVIAHAVVEDQILTNLPAVLDEKRDRLIVDSAVGITKALDEHAGKSKAVSLDRGDGRASVGGRDCW